MAAKITEGNFDEALRIARGMRPQPQQFWAFANLMHAVIFEFPASHENDRRQDALSSAIAASPFDRTLVIQRARRNAYGVQEYMPDEAQEVEVLTDGLDDPKTRWFVAALLLDIWDRDELRIPNRIHERVIDLLGTPPGAERFSRYRKAREALQVAAQRPPQVKIAGELKQPKLLWACRDYLFEDEEWAQAYAGFMGAKDVGKKDDIEERTHHGRVRGR